MRIIKAKNSGFCFGVKRAMDIVQKLSKKHKKIYTNGPIIHNPQVIKKLQSQGIRVAKDISSIKSGVIVIRTHGVKKGFNIQNTKELKFVDATCPFVKRAQEIVKELSKNNYRVIILGDKKHPEVEGLLSYSENAIIIKDLDELKKTKLSGKVGFLSQTTQSIDEFKKISRYIKKKNKDAVIYDTICKTTSMRQDEVEEISKKCDIMLIIGGKNSANTKRLTEIARQNNTNTYLVETARDVKKNWFKNIKVVGVATGASTPEWIINEVIKKIKRSSTDG